MIEGREHLIREMQEELFQKQGQGWFRIVSGSMRPLIDVHDRVLAKRVNPATIKPRDIVLFRNSDALVTHRVIKVARHNGKARILQRGDAGGTPGAIAPEAILGKVVGIEKKGTLLRLDRGRLALLNNLLGLKNCCSYRLHSNIAEIKQCAKDKAWFKFLRAIYRIVKKPLALLSKGFVRLFTVGCGVRPG